MKSLLLVRHAESIQAKLNMRDFDRPLSTRGDQDASLMATRLKERGVQIDTFISSTATRALTTAHHFTTAYGIKQQEIIKESMLYHPTYSIFTDIIATLDDNKNSVAIFSHNPGISLVAAALTKMTIGDMPTCSIVAVKIPIDKWISFENTDKEFWFFDYPEIR